MVSNRSYIRGDALGKQILETRGGVSRKQVFKPHRFEGAPIIPEQAACGTADIDQMPEPDIKEQDRVIASIEEFTEPLEFGQTALKLRIVSSCWRNVRQAR